MLTSSVLQMALIWHLTTQSNSALILSIASLCGFLPSALIGLFAGTFVDRVSRKAAMITADLFLAAVSMILVIAALYGELPIWLILLILALRSVGTAFHTPAISAVTPLLVPESELTKCSGYTQSLQTVGYIAGTAIAGALYPVCSISQMVAFDVAGAVIAAITVLLIKIPKLESKAETGAATGIWAETKAGYLVFKKDKGLFALLWTAAAFMLVYSPINALYPLMSLSYFGGTTLHASIAEITFSVGMLIGGVALGVWGGFKNRAYSIVGSMALVGITTGLSGLLPQSGFWLFAVLCVFMGFSAPFYNGPVTALMQERIAPEYLGRAFGLYGSIASLTMPLGLVLSGAFADRVGIHNWFALTGVACTLLAVLMYAIPSIRRIDGEKE